MQQGGKGEYIRVPGWKEVPGQGFRKRDSPVTSNVSAAVGVTGLVLLVSVMVTG